MRSYSTDTQTNIPLLLYKDYTINIIFFLLSISTLGALAILVLVIKQIDKNYMSNIYLKEAKFTIDGIKNIKFHHK